MSNALLSILALYNYDNSIFDNLQVPPIIDREVLKDNLLLELAEFEVLYSSPEMMKFAIGAWSKKELPIWQKLYDTTLFEYNPIHNYDRTEETVDLEERNLKVKNSEIRDLHGTDNETRNLTGTNQETRNLTETGDEIRNLQGTNNETRNLKGTNKELRDIKTIESDVNDSSTTTKHDSDTSGTTTNTGTDITSESKLAFNSTTPTLVSKTENELGSGNTSTGKVKYETKNEDTTLIDKDIKETGSVNTDTSDTGTVNRLISDTGNVKNTVTDIGTINRNLSDNGTVKKDISDTGTVTKEDLDTGTVTRTHTVRAQGNIGVTTTQQMIEAERNVVKFNVMDYIIDSFKGRFCILIY